MENNINTEKKTRIEHDSIGEVAVPADKYWGAQTQRSLDNFSIGRDYGLMPSELIRSLIMLKACAASANNHLKPDQMTNDKAKAIIHASRSLLNGQYQDNFPLAVWQTGSGTQSNMNVNEVIANLGNESAGSKLLHPNDDVNMSQSSNDCFPTAMNLSAVTTIKNSLIPAITSMCASLKELEAANEGIIKCGRTHLQDAVPISFSQEISGWRFNLERDLEMIEMTLKPLSELAIGATAVGTGLNAPADFDRLVCDNLSKLTGHEFVPSANKFHSLSSRDEFVFAHGALKALAADLMKMANDIRLMASGPRCGLGEITIPANEPGSSIMPGKLNPTQCEQVTMVAVQVIGNDVAIGMAASQGNFELNVFLPVIAYNFLQSVNLLTESIQNFNTKCVSGIKANTEVMKSNLEQSIMLVTALSPYIGYENAARAAQHAFANQITLKQACIELGLVGEAEYDNIVDPKKMV